MHLISRDLEQAKENRVKAEKALERCQKRLGIKEAEVEVLGETM